MPRIPKRILNLLLSALSAGVVPRTGAPYIAIGRTAEIEALCRDLENVSDGGAFTRFIIGKYGSGKSFLIQLMRGYAAEKNFLTSDADLSPERRLASTGGGGLFTYRELIRNLSSKASPDGGALEQVLTRWLSDLQYETEAGGISPDSPKFSEEISRRIYSVLHGMETGVGAFDFSRVINLYYRAYIADDDEKKSLCLRWLRGEFNTKTEARAALGVTGIINDDNWYEYIKLLSVFSHGIGYGGLIVFIDECVNLYKIPNRISRENNYEKILSIFNDTLQGKAQYLGMIFAGTPQFLEDTRRGLFSYEALRSRLVDNTLPADASFSGGIFGPVMRLRRLSDDELLALIERVTVLFSEAYGEVDITNTEKKDFLYYMLSRAGAETLITPREIIRSYLNALGIIKANPEKRLKDIYADAAPPQSPAEKKADPESIEI